MTAASARGRAASFGWSVVMHLLLLMLLVLRFDRVSQLRAPAQPEIIEAHVVDSVPGKSRTRPPRATPAPSEATPHEEPETATGPEDAGGQAMRHIEVAPAPTGPSSPDHLEQAESSRRIEAARQRDQQQEREQEAQRRRRALEHEAAQNAARAQAELQARAAAEQADRARAERLRKAEHEAAAQAEREAQAEKAARRKAEGESRARAEAAQKAERAAAEKAARDAVARAKAQAEAAARTQSEREARERTALAARAKEEAEARVKAAAAKAARQQAEQDAKVQAQQAARAKAEAAAQAAAEKAAKEKAAQARAEAELQQTLEKEAQERAAAAERRERQERERALRDQLTQEAEAGDEAYIDDAAQQWAIGKIKPRIKARWVRPPSAGRGMSCKMRVSTDAGGRVTGVVLGSCSGDAAFARSAEAAVMKASPLPMPPDPRVSARLRSFQITFQPE